MYLLHLSDEPLVGSPGPFTDDLELVPRTVEPLSQVFVQYLGHTAPLFLPGQWSASKPGMGTLARRDIDEHPEIVERVRGDATFSGLLGG